MEEMFVATEEKIKAASGFGEIMGCLQGYSASIYTNEDDGYEYLEDGCICIAVLNPSGEDDLYIDIEDGYTLTCGDWDAYYEPYQGQLEQLCRDIRSFLQGAEYLAVVTCDGDWICSLSVGSAKIDRGGLIHQTKEFLCSAACDVFVSQMEQYGCEISCCFWDVKKNRTLRFRPGEFK
jgi:hypothetical protein